MQAGGRINNIDKVANFGGNGYKEVELAGLMVDMMMNTAVMVWRRYLQYSRHGTIFFYGDAPFDKRYVHELK